jgi:hypothetical protein
MKKPIKFIALGLVISFFASIVFQFAYNFIFVTPLAYETTKGGDGKLTRMLYLSDTLEDSSSCRFRPFGVRFCNKRGG